MVSQRFAALSLFLSVPGIFVAWLVESSVPFGGAPPSPCCSSAFSWLWSDPFSFSSPSLWSVLGGAALCAFLLFRLLVSSRLALLFCRHVLWASLFCWWCVPAFSPWLVGWFLQGLRGFGVPPWSGTLFPGFSLFCAFGLSLFGSLPSFLSCSSGVLRPGGCSFPWVSSSTTCVLAYSSGDGFPGVVCSVVCLQSRSHLRCRGSVLFLRLCLVRRLSPSVVFLSCLRNEVTLVWVECGCGFSHSIGTKA